MGYHRTTYMEPLEEGNGRVLLEGFEHRSPFRQRPRHRLDRDVEGPVEQGAHALLEWSGRHAGSWVGIKVRSAALAEVEASVPWDCQMSIVFLTLHFLAQAQRRSSRLHLHLCATSAANQLPAIDRLGSPASMSWHFLDDNFILQDKSSTHPIFTFHAARLHRHRSAGCHVHYGVSQAAQSPNLAYKLD